MATTKKEEKKVEDLGRGVGRRKTAIARVYLREGDGKITVNGRNVDEYFGNELLVFIVKQPLEATDSLAKFNILINVIGGGPAGQAGACRLGIARALLMFGDIPVTDVFRRVRIPVQSYTQRAKNSEEVFV